MVANKYVQGRKLELEDADPINLHKSVSNCTRVDSTRDTAVTLLSTATMPQRELTITVRGEKFVFTKGLLDSEPGKYFSDYFFNSFSD